jgi:Tfp pilus assembly protein PilX
MRLSKLRSRECGMALILALLALLVVSAIGLGMMFMTDTETSINANYKDAQLAFYAMRGGLEEMRDRMRTQSIAPITLPTVMPGLTPGAGATSVLYITNPAAGESFDPTSTSATNTSGFNVWDDEFCHEYFSTNTNMTSPGTLGAPCTTYPAGNTVSTTSSFSSNSAAPPALQNNPLNYKWVRITLKQNGTLSNARVDPGRPLSDQVCWYGMNNQEVAVSSLGGYTTCAAAQAAGFTVSPVYLVTSLAVTPQGSRRIGQYETGTFSLIPPPAALEFDGPAAVFDPAPNSSNYFSSGHDAATPGTGWGGPGSCTPTGPSTVPSIITGDAQGVTNLLGSIPSNRYGNYTGSGPTPSIVNDGPTGGAELAGGWSSPSQLNMLVAEMANAADVTYNCGYGNNALSATQNGTPCSPGVNLGTNANPQITFVNGDYDMGAHTGAGVLVVTGTLSINGNSGFNGLVLVIGQGYMSEQGAGHGQFNGSVFLANTNSHTAPFSQLGILGVPKLAWNGGGTNGIQYNSCWANIGNQLHYTVVASREEMY